MSFQTLCSDFKVLLLLIFSNGYFIFQQFLRMRYFAVSVDPTLIDVQLQLEIENWHDQF